jgi:hypothetical protein
MAIPAFRKYKIETLAKRVRFQCSNPDCGVHTVGPNTDRDKATTIGEAAHIHGAKPGSMRYDTGMSDASRAEITNGIWLCRNCHGKIDRDENEYSVDLRWTPFEGRSLPMLWRFPGPGASAPFQSMSECVLPG